MREEEQKSKFGSKQGAENKAVDEQAEGMKFESESKVLAENNDSNQTVKKPDLASGERKLSTPRRAIDGSAELLAAQIMSEKIRRSPRNLRDEIKEFIDVEKNNILEPNGDKKDLYESNEVRFAEREAYKSLIGLRNVIAIYQEKLAEQQQIMVGLITARATISNGMLSGQTRENIEKEAELKRAVKELSKSLDVIFATPQKKSSIEAFIAWCRGGELSIRNALVNRLVTEVIKLNSEVERVDEAVIDISFLPQITGTEAGSANEWMEIARKDFDHLYAVKRKAAFLKLRHAALMVLLRLFVTTPYEMGVALVGVGERFLSALMASAAQATTFFITKISQALIHVMDVARRLLSAAIASMSITMLSVASSMSSVFEDKLKRLELAKERVTLIYAVVYQDLQDSLSKSSAFLNNLNKQNKEGEAFLVKGKEQKAFSMDAALALFAEVDRQLGKSEEASKLIDDEFISLLEALDRAPEHIARENNKFSSKSIYHQSSNLVAPTHNRLIEQCQKAILLLKGSERETLEKQLKEITNGRDDASLPAELGVGAKKSAEYQKAVVLLNNLLCEVEESLNSYDGHDFSI